MNTVLSLNVLAPALLAGLFAIIVAVVSARLTLLAERRKFDRELEKTKETWRREFSIQYAQAVATNKELAERLSQQFASAFLYIRNPELAVSDRRFIPAGANMTIGADPSCDITLPNVEHSVTGKHAIIQFVGDSFELVDLRSSAGTFVNGKRITKPTRIADGNLISFGKCEAHFVSVRQI